MKRSGPAVDLSAYGQAVPRLLTHPSIFIAPLIGAAIAMLFDVLGQMMTDPIGGLGFDIYGLFSNLALLFAFAIAIVQASHLWRGRRASFADAWQEARAKGRGILFAAFGVIFVILAANYVDGDFLGFLGQYGFGGSLASHIVELVAAFFIIYTMPAAAIGGLPGGAAISGSIRGVKINPIAALVLTIVTLLLWLELPRYVLIWVAPYIGIDPSSLIANAVPHLVEALVVAYLAFPFAKLYDDIAFRAFR